VAHSDARQNKNVSEYVVYASQHGGERLTNGRTQSRTHKNGILRSYKNTMSVCRRRVSTRYCKSKKKKFKYRVIWEYGNTQPAVIGATLNAVTVWNPSCILYNIYPLSRLWLWRQYLYYLLYIYHNTGITAADTVSRTKRSTLIFVTIGMCSECCWYTQYTYINRALALPTGNLIVIAADHRNADPWKISAAVVTCRYRRTTFWYTVVG
jgi:hypothetical protein